jgi:hypothetical protein
VAEALTIFFVLQFLVFVICFFIKVYNVASMDEPSPIKDSIMTLVVGLFAYGVGIFTILTDYSSLTYIVLFRFQTLFVVFFFILFFIELFVFYKSLYKGVAGQRSKEAYKSN